MTIQHNLAPVDTKYLLDAVPSGKKYYEIGYGDWSEDYSWNISYILMDEDGQFWEVSGSGCSCNGPSDGMNSGSVVTEEELRSDPKNEAYKQAVDFLDAQR
jgi:hypothetical protein